MDQCQKSKEDNGWKCDKRKIFKMWLFAKEMVQIFALVETKDTLNDLSKASCCRGNKIHAKITSVSLILYFRTEEILLGLYF